MLIAGENGCLAGDAAAPGQGASAMPPAPHQASPAERIDVQHVSRAVLLDEELQRSGLDRQIGACHL